MARKIIDLSTPIVTEHLRWAVDRKTVKSHANGDVAEITWLGFSVHGFTHMDSGRHFDAQSYTTDDISLDQVMGEAAVVDLAGIAPNSAIDVDCISAAGQHIRPGDIVLMRTCWDEQRSLQTEQFWTDAPYMTAEASRWLYDRSIKAIAFDFPQDRCIRDYVTGARSPSLEENVTHLELLLKGMPMFEYLCNTGEISQSRVEFIGLPLKIPHCDGAPARVIAIVPTADRQKATVKVRVGFKERDQRVLPDMGVKVAFMEDEDQGANLASESGVLVSRGAIRTSDGVPYVFVVQGSVAQRREIELGSVQGQTVQVLDGVAAGDRVVVAPPDDLETGTEVQVL